MTDRNQFGISRRYLLGGSAALATTGCYGSFNLTGLVYDWNGSFSSKWVRWLVFLGLLIVPVYGVMLFVDAFILNAIEFFSGEHPVERSTLKDGSTVTAEATDDPKTTRLRREREGTTLAVLYVERQSDSDFVLRDESGAVLTRVRRLEHGVEVRDGDGRTLVSLDEAACERAMARARQQGSVARALADGIAEQGATARVAANRERLRL